VNNPPPTTTVVVPSGGSTVKGNAVSLDASALSGVSQVRYELTGGLLTDSVIATATPTYYGWLAQWNSQGVPDGTYTLQSVASYAGGVSGESPGVTVTVAN
jgi:Bacterial Ig domain